MPTNDHKHPTGDCVLEMHRVANDKVKPLLAKMDTVIDSLTRVTLALDAHSADLRREHERNVAEIAALKVAMHGPDGHNGVKGDVLALKEAERLRRDRINGVRSWLAANAVFLAGAVAYGHSLYLKLRDGLEALKHIGKTIP